MGNIFIVKRCRLGFWLGFAIIVLMIILAGANTSNIDLESSVYEYYFIEEVRQGEWLNFVIEEVFRKLNFSFEIYRLFLYIVGYILIFSTVNKFFGSNIYVSILYFIYPFTIDFIQTPNFCSMCLFIFATRYLVEIEKTSNKIKYILVILLAAGMHSMAYIYLPILFLVIYINRKSVLKYGIIFVVLGLTLGIADRIGLFIPKLVFGITNDPRMTLYFNSYTRLGFLLYWTIQILLTGIVFISCKLINDKGIKFKNHKKTVLLEEYSKVIFVICCYGLLLMPIVGYSGTVFRLIRNYYIIVYALWGYTINMYFKQRSRWILKLITLLFPILMFCLESDAVKENVRLLFANNWLIS